jgi:hypothetical protein
LGEVHLWTNEVETSQAFSALESSLIEKRINAAYQLRSSYVHTGKRFGKEIQDQRFERQIGEFIIENADDDTKKFLKALTDAPTFKGLERLMRFCLLRFLETNNIIQFPSITTLTPLAQSE